MTDIISNKKAVVFDFDGTLIEISKRDYKVYCDIMEQYGYRALEYKSYWNMRLNRTSIMDVLSSNNVVSPDFLNCFLKERGELIEHPSYLLLDELLPNVVFTLDQLSKKFDCYLITSRNNVEATLSQIETLGINKYIKKTIVTNGAKLETFRSIPNLSMVVGDTENDILPAKQLLVATIAVTTGIRSLAFLQKLEPNYIVKDILEVLNILCLE